MKLGDCGYGGWIYPDGKIEEVPVYGHHEWLFENGYDSYRDAYRTGLVRFVLTGRALFLQSATIKNTHRVYWVWRKEGLARQSIHIDYMKKDGSFAGSLSYELPKDREKLLSRFCKPVKD